jgi:hypothetical protein
MRKPHDPSLAPRVSASHTSPFKSPRPQEGSERSKRLPDGRAAGPYVEPHPISGSRAWRASLNVGHQPDGPGDAGYRLLLGRCNTNAPFPAAGAGERLSDVREGAVDARREDAARYALATATARGGVHARRRMCSLPAWSLPPGAEVIGRALVLKAQGAEHRSPRQPRKLRLARARR